MGTGSVYQPQQPSNRRYLCGIGSFDNNCAASDYEDFYYTHHREPAAGPLSHPPPAPGPSSVWSPVSCFYPSWPQPPAPAPVPPWYSYPRSSR